MKWSIYLTKLSKIFPQITFPMKQSTVMIEINNKINNNIKQLIQEINNTYRS